MLQSYASISLLESSTLTVMLLSLFELVNILTCLGECSLLRLSICISFHRCIIKSPQKNQLKVLVKKHLQVFYHELQTILSKTVTACKITLVGGDLRRPLVHPPAQRSDQVAQCFVRSALKRPSSTLCSPIQVLICCMYEIKCVHLNQGFLS